jgi:acetyl-CoA acetyltransferase
MHEPDDLAAHILRELTARDPSMAWSELDDVVRGCAAARQLRHTGARRAVATMCIGVGQGISVLLERAS